MVTLYTVDFLDRVPEPEWAYGFDMEGACTGTPAVSADGTIILSTSNAGSKGFAYVSRSTDGFTIIFHRNYSVPLSPIGCFWNPVESNYEQGRNSTQDVFVWGYARSASNNRTIGQVYAFQFHYMTYDDLSIGVRTDFQDVGGERDFVSPHAPVIAHSGLSMFWAVSGNKQRAWIGQQGDSSRDFSTDGVGTVSFPDNNSTAAATAPPVVSSDPLNSFVIGPTASNQLFRLTPLDYALQNNDSLIVPTVSPVTSRVVLSRDESRAYYATSEPNGTLNCVNSTTLELLWTLSIPDGVPGDMALSLNGDTLYVVSALGRVQAFAVGEADDALSTWIFAALLVFPVLGLVIYLWRNESRESKSPDTVDNELDSAHDPNSAIATAESMDGAMREQRQCVQEQPPPVAVMDPAAKTSPDYKDQCRLEPVWIRLEPTTAPNVVAPPSSVSSAPTLSSGWKREGSQAVAAFCTEDDE